MAPAMSVEAANSPKALILLATDTKGVLSAGASIGYFALGGVLGGLLIYIVFRIKNWMSTPAPAEEAPLLEKTNDTDSTASTACTGGG